MLPLSIEGGLCIDVSDVLREALAVEYAAKKGAGGAQIALPYWMELTEEESLTLVREMEGLLREPYQI